jgi:hypothetical protein
VLEVLYLLYVRYVLNFTYFTYFTDAAREACRTYPGGKRDEREGWALSDTYNVEELSWADPRILTFASGSDPSGSDPTDAADGVQEGGLAGGGGLGGGDDSAWIGTLDLGQVACPSLERRSLELVSAVCF